MNLVLVGLLNMPAVGDFNLKKKKKGSFVKFLIPEVCFCFFFSTLPKSDLNVLFEVQLKLGLNNAQLWLDA